jgi:YVTN family beta-propeller protein
MYKKGAGGLLLILIAAACGNDDGGGNSPSSVPADQDETPVLFALLTSNLFPDPPSLVPASSIEVVELASMTGSSHPIGNRRVTSLAVLPDGTRVFVADQTNNVVLIIDPSTGNSLGSIPLKGPRDLVMSADGLTLFANGTDSIVSIDTTNNSIRQTFRTTAAAGQLDVTLGLAISSDGTLLATPGVCQSVCNDGLDDEGGLYVLDARTMTLRARVPIRNPGEPTNCATSPNDVVFGPSNRILLWDSNCDNLYQLDSTTFQQLTAETVRLGRDDGSSFNYNNILSFSSPTGQAYVVKEGKPTGGQLVPALGIIDPMQHSGSTVTGFDGTAFVPALAADGKSLYVSVIHRFSGGGADTLARYDALTNTFSRGVYTFTSSGMVRDMHIIARRAASGSIVPLYTYPTDSSWNAIIAAKQAHPRVSVIAVVNPFNGPGPSVDANYTNGISRLRNAGIKVIGYVYTQHGQRLATQVQADIDTWRNFYPQIEGIFFDEMANTSGGESYYRDLSSYAKNTRGFSLTVGNPGTDTLPSYVGTVDVMIIYESPGLPSSSILTSWHTQFDPSNFGILPYSVSLDTNFVRDAKTLVKYQYLTDDSGANPWDSLSNYFATLLATLE